MKQNKFKYFLTNKINYLFLKKLKLQRIILIKILLGII